MNRFLEKVFIIVYLVLIAVGVSGCGSNDSTDAKSESELANRLKLYGYTPKLDTNAEVSLNVLGLFGNFEALERVFNDFNQYYPNVTLTYEYADNIMESAPIRCAARDAVDIVFINSNEYEYYCNELCEKYLVDLKETDVNLSVLDEQVLRATASGEKQYFLPVFFQSSGLLVNKTLLERYGLQIPGNRGEFEEVCDYLLEKGVTPIYARDKMIGYFFYNHLIGQLQKRTDKAKVMKQLNASESVEDVFEESLSIYEEWEQKGYFDHSGNELADEYEALILRFLEGDIPFMMGISDTISGTKKREAKSDAFSDAPFEYTYIPAPTSENGMECAYVPSFLFGLCNTSKHLDYATEFMRFLATREGLTTMAIVKGMPSVLQDTKDSRLTYFEALPKEAQWVIGAGELSKHTANSLYYSLLHIAEPGMDTKGLNTYFQAYMKDYDMEND